MGATWATLTQDIVPRPLVTPAPYPFISHSVGLPELRSEAFRDQLGGCWVGVRVGSPGLLASLSLTSVLTLSFSHYCCPQPIPWDLWEVSCALAPRHTPGGLFLRVRRPTHPSTHLHTARSLIRAHMRRGPLRLHPSIRTTGMGSLVTQGGILHWLDCRSCWCLP